MAPNCSRCGVTHWMSSSAIAARAQAIDQRDQRDLRRVGDAVEHRLAEERPAERHAVEPADQPTVLPRLDRVRQPGLVQRAVALEDLVVDPGAGIVGVASASAQARITASKVAIDLDPKRPCRDDPRQPRGT